MRGLELELIEETGKARRIVFVERNLFYLNISQEEPKSMFPDLSFVRKKMIGEEEIIIDLLELVAGPEIGQNLFWVDSETFAGTKNLGKTSFDGVQQWGSGVFVNHGSLHWLPGDHSLLWNESKEGISFGWLLLGVNTTLLLDVVQLLLKSTELLLESWSRWGSENNGCDNTR